MVNHYRHTCGALEFKIYCRKLLVPFNYVVEFDIYKELASRIRKRVWNLVDRYATY